LLCRDFIESLEVRGRHVVVVPNRATLFISGEDDAAGLEILCQLAEQEAEKPRPISGTPVVLTGGGWETWVPPADHPHAAMFRKLSLPFELHDYKEQKQLLDRQNEQLERDVFVATYHAIERKDNRQLLSYSVWADQVTTLLPRTDKVVLVQGEWNLMVNWDDLWLTCGDRFCADEELFPPRWLVDSFPSPRELTELKSSENR
jgi:hypothetical protein